ncbi:DUF2550 family protein [Actinotignum sanguinis]
MSWQSVALIVVLVLLALLIYFLARVRYLFNQWGSSQAAVRRQHRWHTGVVFFRTDALEWFRVASLSWRPALRLDRCSLSINLVKVRDDIATARVGDAHTEIDMAMSCQAHTALVAWADSAPPRGDWVLF